MKKKAEELKLAQTFNEREIPKEVLESFEVPSVSLLLRPRSLDREGSSRRGREADLSFAVFFLFWFVVRENRSIAFRGLKSRRL